MYKKNIFKINNTSRSGFTLIEFIVYFSILTILIVTTSSMVFQIINNKTKLETVQNINQNARHIIEKITNSVHNAQSIISPALGQEATSLALSFTDNEKNPTIFSTSSGILKIKEGSSPAVPLNADELASVISFTNVSYPDTPGSVRIVLTISSVNLSGQQSYTHSETFYTTVTIRPK